MRKYYIFTLIIFIAIGLIIFLTRTPSNLSTNQPTNLNSPAVIEVTKGGTGLQILPTEGQILVGGPSGYTLKNLVAGTNVTITSDTNSIIINSQAIEKLVEVSGTTSLPTGLQYLQNGCSNNGILKWNSSLSTWVCSTDLFGTTTTTTNIINNESNFTVSTGTSGLDFNVTGSPISSGGTLTLNLPDASMTARGLITIEDQILSGNKTLNNTLSINGNNTGSTNNYALYIEGATGGTISNYALFVNSGLSRFAPATSSTSSINLASSLGTNPSSLGSGDLWWNGTNLNFYTGSNTVDILSKVSGADGTIQYNNGGTLGGDSNLFWDDTAGRLGIGTSTPTEKLTIAGGNIMIGARSDVAGSWTKISQPTAGTVASGGTPNIETVRSMAVYNGSLYVGTQESGAAEIYRYNGGTDWTRVSFGAGQIGSGGIATVDSVNKLTVYNGKLYAATGRTNQAELFVYEGGTTWTRLNSTAGRFVASGTASINEIESIVVYNGSLYFGTTEANLAEVYKYDGSTFTKVTDAAAGTVVSGGTAAIDSISSLAVYNGDLYLGTNETGAGEVYRYTGGSGWTKITQVTAGVISEAAGASTAVKGVRNMAVYNGSLYIGTEDDSDAEVYRYNGGTSWTAIGTGVPGEFTSGGEQFDKVHSMAVYQGQLFIGLDDVDDAVVFKLNSNRTWTRVTDPVDGTIINGNTTDITEIRSLTVFNDTLIAGTAKTNAAEVYQYTEFSNSSYALKFTSNSNYTSPEPGFNNQASIVFNGAQQANSNRGNDAGGQFIFSHGLATATGAYDVAEDYPTRETNLEFGEIVSIDKNEDGFVKRATKQDSTMIAGIYSENPAIKLSQQESSGAYMISVALVGRVKVKIAKDSAPIKSGDTLTVSTTPGKATKSRNYDYTIGKALEYWDCTDPESSLCKDQIMVMVQQSIWIEPDSQNDSSEMYISSQTSSVNLTSGLAQVTSLQPIKFTLADGLEDIGFLSENVSKVSPFLVSGKSIRYNRITTLLVQAVKEIDARLANVEKDIDALKNNIKITKTGNVTIPAGQESLKVDVSNFNVDSKAFLTLKSLLENNISYYVENVQDGFVIKLSTSSTKDINFDYFIVIN